MRSSIVRVIPALLVAASLFAVPFAYSVQRKKQTHNFRVVEEGKLYRSGQLSKAGLERVVHDYGIKTVVSFRDAEEGKSPVPPDLWEEAFCATKGINHLRLPLRHWSFNEKGVVPADENVKKFLALLADPKNQPVLAHCFRGVHRTGMYCAIYRMDHQAWSNDDAIREIQELGYDKFQNEADVRGYLERYVPSGKKAAGSK